jgi:hypothetical protein
MKAQLLELTSVTDRSCIHFAVQRTLAATRSTKLGHNVTGRSSIYSNCIFFFRGHPQSPRGVELRDHST